MAQGRQEPPPWPRADRRRHRPLPEDRGGAGRDHPPDAGDRRCYQPAWRLAGRVSGRDPGRRAFASCVADIRAMISQQDRMAVASEELTASLMARVFQGDAISSEGP